MANAVPYLFDPNGVPSMSEQFGTPIPWDPNLIVAGGATNTAVTVTIVPDAKAKVYIGQIEWSYNGSSTPAGQLNVDDGGGVVYQLDIVGSGGAGANNIQFLQPRCSRTAGSSTNIYLTAAAGATGKLNVHAWSLK